MITLTDQVMEANQLLEIAEGKILIELLKRAEERAWLALSEFDESPVGRHRRELYKSWCATRVTLQEALKDGEDKDGDQ